MTNFSIVAVVISLLISINCHAGKYEVGVENLEYLPFSTVSKGQYSGYFKELLDKFGADNGHSFTYTALPIKRLGVDFLNGKLDFKVPDNQYWMGSLKTGKSLVYSTPITTYVDGVMVMPFNKGKPYTELSTLATVRGFTPFPFLDDIAKGSLKLQEANSLDSVIKMVESDRVKGGFMNVTVASYYMDKVMGKSGTLVYDDSLPKGISEISVSTINKPKIIEELNSWLNANADWISSLKQKYGID